MSSTIHGTGKKRRDDVYNRVTDLFLRGQVTPLGGFYTGAMAKLMSTPSKNFVNVQLNHPENDLKFIICGKSKCGGPDICS